MHNRTDIELECSGFMITKNESVIFIHYLVMVLQLSKLKRLDAIS